MLVPDLKTPMLYVLGFLLVGALATAGIERTRVHKAKAETSQAKADLAAEKLSRAQENTARSQAALDDITRIGDLERTHASTQQETVHAYESKLKTLVARGAADADYRRRMSGQFAASAASDRQEARGDAAACERIADRSQVVAGLADEGVELLIEGRSIVEARDAEVGLLLDTIRNDRALLAPPSAAGGSGSAITLSTGKAKL